RGPVVAARRLAVRRTAAEVVGTARARDRGARSLFQVSNAVPGMGLVADAGAIRAVAGRADVVSVSALVPKRVDNAGAVQLTRVLDTWRASGSTGRGVSIGIVDTGLDYTHADFGGRGTVAASEAALAAPASPAWRSRLPAAARAKVMAGYDLVGDDYNADPAAADYDPVPAPDPDPMDCGQHGTHVAGIAAGYGVTGSGRTFAGSYRRLSGRSLLGMEVGPGVAPLARIYPMKIFGCGPGASEMVIPALDRALDPDGDGDFTDHLDVVNLSLGGGYGAADDPDSLVVDELSRHGVLTVVAGGNDGDLLDVGGSPAAATSSISVASTVDGYDLLDGVRVEAPAPLAGLAGGDMSQAYDWSGSDRSGTPVRGRVVTLPGGNADGCDPLGPVAASRAAGRVVWLEWASDAASRRCGSAARAANLGSAGAIGVLLARSAGTAAGSDGGILGDDAVPMVRLSLAQSQRLRGSARAGRLRVAFDGALRGAVLTRDRSAADTLSESSSRGSHGATGTVKPDVAAPGDTVASAAAGTGTGRRTLSGTSMATPHVAGIAALVRSRHPGWGVTAVKAAVMNNAVHDVWTRPGRRGRIYGPQRVGAGRVDAARSVAASVLAYSPNPDQRVSVSFGPVPVDIRRARVRRVRNVTVENTGSRPVRVAVRYQGVVRQPGVVFRAARRSLRVPARSTRNVKVVMTVVPRALRHRIDPTMAAEQEGIARQFLASASGRLLLTPGGRGTLRVPVDGTATPTAATSTRAVPSSADDGPLVVCGAGVGQGRGRPRYRSL
ncbi:MAG: S8 family serine peptidase, partial [Nocardioidaceae bacterium]